MEQLIDNKGSLLFSIIMLLIIYVAFLHSQFTDVDTELKYAKIRAEDEENWKDRWYEAFLKQKQENKRLREVNKKLNQKLNNVQNS